MALVALTETGASTFNAGELSRFRHVKSAFASSFFTSAGSPFMTTIDGNKASMIKYDGTVYGVGGFGKPWVFDRHYRCYKQTMTPTDTPPVVTTTAGAVVCIPYTTFYDKKTGERSSLSGAGASFTWNNSANRTWTLPAYAPDEYVTLDHTTTVNASTTVTMAAGGVYENYLRIGDRIAVSSAPTVFVGITGFSGLNILVDTAIGDGTTQYVIVKAKPRASHVEMWLSVDGADVRLVARRDIGTISAVEAVPTLALGEVAPELFTHFPSCSFNAVYHDRQIMAGNRQAPDTVYLSELFFPERYGGLNFKTRNGEPVTGLVAVRDVLLVMTKSSTYRLQGYTEDDFELVLDDADIGCITHWGIAVIYGDAWVPDTKGIFRWNGAYQPMMKDVQAEWRKDYFNNPYPYENGYAFHDGNDYTYNFVITDNAVDATVPDPNPYNRTNLPWWMIEGGITTLVWVAYYKDAVPQVSGVTDQPDWMFDYYGVELKTVGVLSSSGGKRTDVFFGDCSGVLGIKDPNVALADRFIFQSPHMEYSNPGGSSMDGKTLTELWLYADTGFTTYTIYIVGGDENAWLQTRFVDDTLDPPYIDFAFLAGNPDYVWHSLHVKPNESLVSTVHYYHPEKVVGRGFTVFVISTDTNRLELRGLGGKYMVGPTYVGITQPDAV